MCKLTYNCTVGDNTIRLFINDILHLVVKQSELVGIQSWITGDKTKFYHIEYYFKSDAFFHSEYDCPIKWKSILDLLNEKIELDNIIK